MSLRQQHTAYRRAWDAARKRDDFLLSELVRSGDINEDDWAAARGELQEETPVEERAYTLHMLWALAVFCHPLLMKCKSIVRDRKSKVPLSRKNLGPKDGALYLMAKLNIEKSRKNLRVILKVMMPFVVSLKQKQQAIAKVKFLLTAHAKATLLPRCAKAFHRRLLYCQRTWRKTYAARRCSVLCSLRQMNNEEDKHRNAQQTGVSVVLSRDCIYKLHPSRVEAFRQATNPELFLWKGCSVLTSRKKSPPMLLFQFKMQVLLKFKEESRRMQTQDFLTFWSTYSTRAKVSKPRTKFLLLPQEIRALLDEAAAYQSQAMLSMENALRLRYNAVLSDAPHYLPSLFSLEWSKVVADGKKMELAFVEKAPALFAVEEWHRDRLPECMRETKHLPRLRNLYHEGLEALRLRTGHHVKKKRAQM